MLIFNSYYLKDAITLAEKYNLAYNIYADGNKWIIQNLIKAFEPIEKDTYFELNKLHHKCIYNKEVRNFIHWVNEKIVLRLGHLNLTTINVLLRIATGMLNKIDILTPIEKIILHLNMTRNIKEEYFLIQELPF